MTPVEKGWQPIESAPRNSGRILVAYKNLYDEWRVHEAWWRIPYEGAPAKHGHWCYDGDTVLLSADVHASPEGKPLGATHWMPLPSAPGAECTDTERDAGRWVPWKPGDALPKPGAYRITATALGNPPIWTAECNVLEADNLYARRFDWIYTSTIIAYWSTPLPPPYDSAMSQGKEKP